MGKALTLLLRRNVASVPAGSYWQVVGDESLVDWNYASRTIHPDLISYGFKQLPSVMRYSRTLEYKASDYRVDETRMQQAYYDLNNYDGNGVDRCENYLFRNANALYNSDEPSGRGFPKRQYLTMSGNLLKEISWETNDKNQRFLRFQTLTPSSVLGGLAYSSHPWFVHRYDLVSWSDVQDKTLHTWVTNRQAVYYYLVSLEGFAFIHERYVRKV